MRSLTKKVRSRPSCAAHRTDSCPPATLKNDDAEESEEEGDDIEARAEEQALRADAAKRKAAERQPTGRVVGVIKRNWRSYVSPVLAVRCATSHGSRVFCRYVCHIDATSLTSANPGSLSQQTVFATPVSRLLPRIRLRTRQAPALLGHKIVVTLDRWDATSRYPEGHFVRSLGAAESKEAEQESLLLEFDVPYRPFGKAILDCLPKEGDAWVVPPKSESHPDWRDREDLRELLICSIDPPGASLNVGLECP